jgi:Icc protein
VPKILQISDLHILAGSKKTMEGVDTEASFKAVLEHALNRHPDMDLILVTGDLAQTPCEYSYQLINRILQATGIPALCLPGNHDDPLLMEQIFTGQTRYQKHLILQDWQIIALNSHKAGSEGGFLANEELENLHQILTRYSQPALIAVHHHPVPCGSRWMDRMMIDNQEALFQTLKRFTQVKSMVFGHIHQTLEIEYQGIRLLGCPSTCFQFQPLSEHYALDTLAPGCRILHLQANDISMTDVMRLK